MNPALVLGLVVAAFVMSLLLTLLIERRSTRLGLMQAPNERSSHVIPTPRGGGLGLAVASVLCCLFLATQGSAPFLWIAVLGSAIALLGFIDDLRDLSPAIRFGVQIALLALLIAVLSPLPGLVLPYGLVLGGWVLATILVLAGVWWVNLFNFMDGIDGIAASQAMLILLGAALIWITGAPEATATPLFCLILAIAAAALGFLLRNWPPAHIFMGDVGSVFLAFMILAIALLTIAAGALNYGGWLILVSACLCDTSVTLVRRVARGEKPWKAHRRHAYQQLSRLWGHQRVTLLYGAITLFWALPLALLAARNTNLEWILVLVALAPIIALVIWVGGGEAVER